MSTKKATPKPAARPSIRKTNAPGAAKPDKAPRTRKPMMERAAKLANLAMKKLTALAKMAAKWRGEATTEQSAASARLNANLLSVRDFVEVIVKDAGFLHTSGFAPTSGSAGRKPLATGTRVKIKDAKFDPEVYGEDNDFEVIGTTEKYIRIQGVANSDVQAAVLRAWIEILPMPTDAAHEDDAA